MDGRCSIAVDLYHSVLASEEGRLAHFDCSGDMGVLKVATVVDLGQAV